MKPARLALLFVLTLLHACSSQENGAAIAAREVSLAVVNARIWTGDPDQPWAQTLAIDGSRIAQVGSAELAKTLKAERTIDAQGRLIVPGFIDSHVHAIDGGIQLSSVQLRDVRSQDEFAARIKEFAATVPAGSWITGGNWDHTLWGGELPTRAWLDAASPDHPVWINRLDGHMALANSQALALASVTRMTRDVDGGEIVRDARGEPTGILKDNAMSLIDAVVPPPTTEAQDRGLSAAMRYMNERGVTSFHNMGTWRDIAAFARAAQAGTLTTRIYGVVALAEWEALRDEIARNGASRNDPWLRLGGLKGFVDGSLGSHTAAFYEPFKDAPQDRGLLVNTPEQLHAWIAGADQAELQVMVHAIGDRANGILLDTYERVGKENGVRDRRFRIEHAQHLRAGDIPRFGSLGIIASMQPYHLIDDGRWAEQFIGERVATTYAFHDLLAHKVTLAFGSDWYVAPAAPLEGIYSAVTRRTLDDKHPAGWVPEQKISVEDALRAYTLAPAYASFEENSKGKLAPGFLADFVVLDRDLLAIPPEQIRDAKVDMTVVDGKIVFERVTAARK